MRCVACDAELITGKPFCAMCGTRSALRCEQCGGGLEPTFRFCPQCGARVAASDGATAPSAPSAAAPVPMPPSAPAVPVDGERKQVTVLFCDLVGSTQIAERLDPEEYREIIERYLERVFPEVYRFGGIVNTLAGDGLMALFGAPVAHEDDPRRAVRAALAIRDTLAGLADTIRAERDIELRARIGIHTGPVVVGTVGTSFKMDYTAIGDTTNLAARLQTAARPGSILISDATHRLVRGRFVVEATGPLDVRGKSEPVVAYEVIGRAAGTSPMTIAAERGLTPLVGRGRELARLEDAFARASEGLRVVAVVGEAGIGKSRLLYELRRRLAGRVGTYFEGRCSSMNQLVPYHPMLSMLRNFFELAPDEAPDVAQARLAGKLGVGYAHVEHMFPLLSRFLSLPGGSGVEPMGDGFKREIFDAVAELVLHAPGPVVVAMEDLHWIDESSRELLGALVKRVAAAPVLVVATQRPDAPGIRVPGGVEVIPLPRLADAEIAEILHAVGGGALPGDLAATLVAKAAGSPFFAEELMRSLVEGGYVERTAAGGLLPAGPLAELPIPGTIHEVVAARLDRLAPQAKRVVQVAAVLGRQFARAHLAAILADEGIDVPAALDELVRRGILHRNAGVGGDELRFGESLTQEIAYEALLLRQRRLLHERVARYLERQPGGGPERSALLAHHWSRSDDRGRAAEALVAAGRDAEAVPSYGVAADFYRRAWEAAEAASGELPDDRYLRIALEATSGVCRLVVYFGLPLAADAARAAARGRQLAEYFHDSEATASFFYMLGVMKMTADDGSFDAGLALVERGLALAQSKGLRLAAARIVRGLAINYAIDGRFAEAHGRIDPLLAVMEATESGVRPGDLYLSARWVKAVVLYASDELDAARAHVERTLALADRVRNRTMLCSGTSLLAQIHCLRGEYARARALAHEALALAEEIGNVNVLPAAASVALIAHAELGEPLDVAHALDCIERGLAAAGFMQLNARFVVDGLLAIGDVARAAHHAETLGERIGGRLRRALTAVATGDVMQRLGRPAAAREAYETARTLAGQIGARSVLVSATLGLAEVTTAEGGEPDPAALAEADRLCADLGLGRYAVRLARVATPMPVAASS